VHTNADVEGSCGVIVVGSGGWLLLPHIIYLLRAANNGGHGKEWGVERAFAADC